MNPVANPANVKSKRRGWPILGGVLPITWAQAPAEIVAGVTLAALAIPEVMGYTKIAGMPVVTGLYTMLIPLALYAVLGSSRHLVVGADSATAAIMAAGLAGLAATASPQYVALAGVLALMTALLLVLGRVLRIGFLADFLSRTVLIGFLSGVGVQVAIGQLAGMLGIPSDGGGPLEKLATILRQLDQTNLIALAIALGVLAIIVGARGINPKIPGALLAVLAAILASYALDLAAYGVAVVGAVPGGLPQFGLPAVDALDWNMLQQLFAIALSMFVVIVAQSAATARAYATRYRERFDENTDLVGLSAANIGAGLTGTFVVNGSPTKTQMVDSAGGRSQFAMLVTAAIVLIVLLFLTAPLAYLPEAALSAVVFLIGLELIDVQGMRRVWVERPVEFGIALLTLAIVVFVGVEQGIVMAIILSLLAHTRHGYQPNNSVLTLRDGRLHVTPVAEAGEAAPGIVIYRFNHSMYYANTERMAAEVLTLAKAGPDRLQWFCCDLVAVDDVDFSAAATWRELHRELHEQAIRLVFSSASDHVRAQLDVSGITALVGTDAYYPDPVAALDAFHTWEKAHDRPV
jgi:SulP family sulfate permease